MREQRMLSQVVPNTDDISMAGTLFTSRTLESFGMVDLTQLPAPTIRVAVVDREASAPFGYRFSAESPAEVESVVCRQLTDVLDRPAEEAVVAPALVEALAGPILRGLVPQAASSTRHYVVTDATIPAEPGEVRESFCTVGPDELTAVLTSPVDKEPEDLLVLLNSGSDPHTGPGRAWVDYARQVAPSGFGVLRVDLRGWGDSPDNETPPGRPYDQHAVGDVARLVRALRADGWRTISVGGLCAGAWIALEAARSGALDGVVALNPQMYWQPGDPVEALMSTTRQRREPEIARIKSAAARGVWDMQDAAGDRPPAAQWLDDLAAGGSKISLIFSEGDDGLEYLRDRLGRRLAAAISSGRVIVGEVPGIDHGMHRVWLRSQMISAITSALRRTKVQQPDGRG
ncbi:alpha/beta hydrolase [Flexivirga caeni]|uniref:alpha/beta hydrolase n=1 Tax=Flexivirga caeni TaxID=2294115 RepID=UPI0013150D12|nr:alpha/beta hydrolase [Flexivirga caeni]